jgi:hypothetical protein
MQTLVRSDQSNEMPGCSLVSCGGGGDARVVRERSLPNLHPDRSKVSPLSPTIWKLRESYSINVMMSLRTNHQHQS